MVSTLRGLSLLFIPGCSDILLPLEVHFPLTVQVRNWIKQDRLRRTFRRGRLTHLAASLTGIQESFAPGRMSCHMTD